MKTTSAKGISVVTTTWNEKENLEKLIPRIQMVLKDIPHEIIVVDDSSPDGTIEVARRLANVAITKTREGQTKGLLTGMKQAQYPAVVTIDSDLENSPETIPKLREKLADFDVVVASRTKIPRISEKIASRTLGRLFGVSDFFSNFRAYKTKLIPKFELKAGETFGAEFLVIAKKNGLKIGEIIYYPPPRRRNPRIGGTLKANLRILLATIKTLTIYIL